MATIIQSSDIGGNIKKECERIHLSVEDVRQRAGVPKELFYDMMESRAVWHPLYLYAIADTLRCRMEVLLGTPDLGTSEPSFEEAWKVILARFSKILPELLPTLAPEPLVIGGNPPSNAPDLMALSIPATFLRCPVCGYEHRFHRFGHGEQFTQDTAFIAGEDSGPVCPRCYTKWLREHMPKMIQVGGEPVEQPGHHAV